MFDVPCPQCGLIYHADESHIGKHIRCTRCGSLVPILRSDRTITYAAPSQSQPANAHHTQAQSRRPRRYMPATAVGLAVLLIVGLAVYIRRPAGAVNVPRVSDSPAEKLEAPHSQSFGFQPDDAASVDTKKNSNLQWDIISEEPGPKQRTHRAEITPLPDPRPTEYNSLPVGTPIGPDFCTGGHGVLTVKNGTQLDAVARLYDAAKYRTVCWFFVPAEESHRKSAIPEGTYWLSYTTGLDWIEAKDTFRWHPSYTRFGRILRYDEQEAAADIEYDDITVTLQPVIGGNVRAQKISREDFLKGHQHMALER